MMAIYYNVFFIYIFISSHTDVNTLPILKGEQLKYSEDIITYLKRYNYLPSDKNKIDNKEIFEAVLNFQKLIGLPTTGIITPAVTSLIQKPRCREQDIGKHTYQLSQTTKIQSSFTYSIQQWSTHLSRQQQEKVVDEVAKEWSKKMLVNISQHDTNSSVKIIFSADFNFTNQSHIEENKTTLKILKTSNITFIYLNDNITTSVDILKELIAHAFGHLFGLTHQDTSKMMSPILKADKCTIIINGAFSYVTNGNTYFFKDDVYWKVNKDGAVDTDYPKPLSYGWPKVPEKFDGVLVWAKNWNTYFFKGKYFYRFDSPSNTVAPGYPRLIKEGWKGVPDNIDAALTDETMTAYFFKGSLIYRYNNTLKRVDDGFPKSIQTIFPGAPNNIDTAFRNYYDGKTYFLKGTTYYEWNEKRHTIVGPHTIASGWKDLCLK